MNAERPLLVLQQLDSAADGLRARRAGMPERAKLKQGEAEIAALALVRDEARGRRSALAHEERRVETLVTDLEAKVREIESTLYSGKVKASRELEALQLELQGFQRRQSEREDEEMGVLEQEERLDGEIAELEARCAALETQSAELRAAIGSAEAEIDAELARLCAQRAELVAQLAAPLLADYEKLRSHPKLAGRVAVPVDGGTCRGCRTVLPTALASRLHVEAKDGIVHCPSCLRILVT